MAVPLFAMAYAHRDLGWHGWSAASRIADLAFSARGLAAMPRLESLSLDLQHGMMRTVRPDEGMVPAAQRQLVLDSYCGWQLPECRLKSFSLSGVGLGSRQLNYQKSTQVRPALLRAAHTDVSPRAAGVRQRWRRLHKTAVESTRPGRDRLPWQSTPCEVADERVGAVRVLLGACRTHAALSVLEFAVAVYGCDCLVDLLDRQVQPFSIVPPPLVIPGCSGVMPGHRSDVWPCCAALRRAAHSRAPLLYSSVESPPPVFFPCWSTTACN